MPAAKGAARALPHPLSALCCGPMAAARAPTEVGKQLKSCHLASEELATLNLCCRKARANGLHHKNTAKAKRGEGGETQALSSPAGARRWCHAAIATELLVPIWQTRLQFPCPRTSQRSWAGRQRKGKRAGCVFSSSGARRKEELKAAKSYWNANCSQRTFGSSEILNTSDRVDQTGSY